MPRYQRKTNYGITDFDALLRAIKDIKINKKRIRPTARSFNIPKSSLARYITKIDAEIADISMVDDYELKKLLQRIASYAAHMIIFQDEQEEDLVDCIKKCCDYYNGLSSKEVRELAYQFAKKLGVRYPPQWDAGQITGRDWYFNFMKRHPNLILRTPEQTCMRRVEEFRKEDLTKFIAEILFEEVIISEEPSIANLSRANSFSSELNSIDPLESTTTSEKETKHTQGPIVTTETISILNKHKEKRPASMKPNESKPKK